MSDVRYVYVSIGNSDDKLTQAEWSDFCERIRVILDDHSHHTHGEWYSLPSAPWQNACWCIDVEDHEVAALQTELAFEAKAFRQRAIAWAEARYDEITAETPVGSPLLLGSNSSILARRSSRSDRRESPMVGGSVMVVDRTGVWGVVPVWGDELLRSWRDYRHMLDESRAENFRLREVITDLEVEIDDLQGLIVTLQTNPVTAAGEA